MENLNVYPQEMRDALEKFKCESIHICNTGANDVVPKESPSIIYHYTDDLGLRGILKTGTLRLTNIFNLNDPSELRHGVSHAIAALKNKFATDSPENKLFVDIIEKFEEKGIEESARYFVCSFSLCGNDLGQWRAYADNGRGYVLGFTEDLVDSFKKVLEISSQLCGTFPVTYNDQKLKKVQQQLIESLSSHMVSVSYARSLGTDQYQYSTYLKDLLINFSIYALYISMYFKHGAYSNEQEYRFLQIHSADLPPTSYREFDWQTLAPKALKKITIGPAADKQKANQLARDCLQDAGLNSVELTYSGLPYRA